MNMNNFINDEHEGYAWEADYEQTWAAIQEDESGKLRTTQDMEYIARKRQMLEKKSNQRLSMMRQMYLIIDLSSCMTDRDLKPNRLLCVIKLLEKFIYSFFDQNPISQVGITLTRNKSAEKICELMSNPRKIVDKLKTINEKYCQGEASIQNSLEICMASLKHLKSHSSREVLLLVGSLSSCDPGDIFMTIKECRSLNIRCSVIALAAEVHAFKYLSEHTLGLYTVILDELHLNDVLQQVAFPLPNNDTSSQALIRMGFPQHKISKQEQSSMCMCHLNTDAIHLSTGGYFCPQCDSKYCEIPVECKACGLTLVCAPHLARSYHHLFPLLTFDGIPNTSKSAENNQSEGLIKSCFGCQENISEETNVFKCKNCEQCYCIECDIFIHETLHSCPGCCSKKIIYQ